jgi:hypothetical protein
MSQKTSIFDTVSLTITRSDHVLQSELEFLATDTSKTITNVWIAILIWAYF